jgi:Icc-related predicted phosphoesterase
MGYKGEITSFLEWFGKTDFKHKIFIAGNHDFGFENGFEINQEFKDMGIHYLQDNEITIDGIKFYGSPWQPEFHNWAFNLPRNGWELEQKWNDIPINTDILITHGPAQGYLDTSGPPWNEPMLGCELLVERIKEIKPKIHLCGHIHGGYGYMFDGDTHFINASVLNERYDYVNKPLTIEWDPVTNSIEFL